MSLGKVVGKVWATIKDDQLEGVKLYVLQPLDKELKETGKPIIAADAVGSGEGELVFWVSSREATYALPDRKIPSDATIVGIIDSHYLEPQENISAHLTPDKIVDE